MASYKTHGPLCAPEQWLCSFLESTSPVYDIDLEADLPPSQAIKHLDHINTATLSIYAAAHLSTSTVTQLLHRCVYLSPSDCAAKYQQFPVVVKNSARSRSRRFVSFFLIATTSFVVGAYVAFVRAPPFLTPLIMGSIPTDAETLEYTPSNDLTQEIDEHIRNCKIAQSLRANPDFVESRPHRKIPDEMKQHNLTAGTLSGDQGLAVPPLIFNEKGGKSMVCIFYAGTDLCGHPGMVHGGFLATMLDEGLARCAFPAMPNKVGVTANLSINYRKPTFAGQYLVLRATTTKVEGRKAWAEGYIEPLEVLDGEEAGKLVEATALFVEPRHAKVSEAWRFLCRVQFTDESCR